MYIYIYIYIGSIICVCVCVLDAYMYWLTSFVCFSLIYTAAVPVQIFVHVYVLVYYSYGPDSHAFIFSVPKCIDAYTLAANNL